MNRSRGLELVIFDPKFVSANEQLTLDWSLRLDSDFLRFCGRVELGLGPTLSVVVSRCECEVSRFDLVCLELYRLGALGLGGTLA